MNDDHPTARPLDAGDRDSSAPGHALTIADVLALPVLAAGQPQVVTGVTHLDRPVRWVHITELTDPASFLKGGELVLTTGMPLPDDTTGVRRYVDELAGIGAAALVIELVRRYHRPPDALVHACRARGLPLITLAKDVNFLEVTQVVHALILGNQAEAMRRTQRIHEAFTALTLRGAGTEDVVRAAADMSGRTVVLENMVHQALICEPSGTTLEEALTDWEQRSRATPPGDRTDLRGPEGWLTAPVEYQGERWGRVAMLPAPTDKTFGPEHITVLERTAMALTVARLIHSTPWERIAHRNALRDLVEQRHRSPQDALARLTALGLPTENSRFLAVVVDLPAADTTAQPEIRLSQELRTTGIPALVGELAPARLGALLALGPSHPWRPTVEQLSRAMLDLVPQAVVSVGTEVDDLTDAPRSFHQATRVAEATPPDQPLPQGRSFHELTDVGLRRLLYALRQDTRIQDYTERQLGRLIDHDTRHGTDLLTTLRHYLDAAGNKTSAARRGGLSRETFYQRLRTIERLLGCDFESGEQRTALHVALTALDVLRVR
ncbi:MULTISPECIES: PucR family transcriptional regulator ligand-binding domain-containing protein [unclassified Streptomyces]|uniref:PucR family transcriptional regulator n=1 Tax=unclassified Streptomyces TaxID=2593676 RepID=UPI002474C2A8|nr:MULTISPECIES: PucR family transcriptional regulator ligand-binding domain-containing protein [unclassified Streptomyces]MDH6455452.1 purine catabolism regulator [Streptomyces sp. SAI-119]MDH6493995.1 purine catabolism regulator [Streptomyces sp. SAI-149]